MNYSTPYTWFIIGAFVAMLLIAIIPGSIVSTGNKELKLCEYNLPRNEYCKMIFVPEKQYDILVLEREKQNENK